jgi:predicted RNase H-like HicB family nuclease/predicted RNA binding protein YcfA (HicA-like mRNA interferase family)
MKLELTAVFQKVPEGYIGFVEELPGTNTQGETLEEARENLEEAIQMVLEANRLLAEEAIQGQDVIRKPVTISPQHEASRLIRHLEAHGCQFLREGGRHTIYLNRLARTASAIPRHREINEFLVPKICRDLQIPEPYPPRDF